MMNRLVRQSLLKQYRWVRPANQGILNENKIDGLIKRKDNEVTGYSHNQVFEYPEDFRPWAIPYNKNGVLVAIVVSLFVSIQLYEQEYLQKVGRTKRDASKVYYVQ